MIPLASVKDLLLPGLRSHLREGVELDIEISYVEDCLWVKGYYAPKDRSLKFTIPRNEILDDSFKGTFGSNVRKLVDELRYGPVPLGAVA